SPVITAHPTEVRRKSIIDHEAAITIQLERRGRMNMPVAEQTAWEQELHRQILLLWQTRMLRPAKLVVQDEVNNGLSYFTRTFLQQLPLLYDAWDRALERVIDGWLQQP